MERKNNGYSTRLKKSLWQILHIFSIEDKKILISFVYYAQLNFTESRWNFGIILEKSLEIVVKLRRNLEKILKKFWKNFEKTLKSFWKNSENFWKCFVKIVGKNVKDIFKYFTKIFFKFGRNKR